MTRDCLSSVALWPCLSSVAPTLCPSPHHITLPAQYSAHLLITSCSLLNTLLTSSSHHAACSILCPPPHHIMLPAQYSAHLFITSRDLLNMLPTSSSHHAACSILCPPPHHIIIIRQYFTIDMLCNFVTCLLTPTHSLYSLPNHCFISLEIIPQSHSPSPVYRYFRNHNCNDRDEFYQTHGGGDSRCMETGVLTRRGARRSAQRVRGWRLSCQGRYNHWSET